MPNISPNAIVEEGATIAPDVQIGPFSFIGRHVRLGAGVIVENNATITGKTVVGEKTHVFPMAVIGETASESQEGRCVIGKACAIREGVIVQGGVEAPTRIGDDNLIMIASQVGPAATVGDHGIFANCTTIGPGTIVEEYVRSSAFAVVEKGARVGAYTFIAGYTTIRRQAPPYAIVQGCPLRIRGVNTENLRRCGFGEDDIRSLKEAFRDLFDGLSSAVNPEALERYLSADANPYVRNVAGILRTAGQQEYS